MDTLPTELKDQICGFLIQHPSTLANLATTSSRFLHIARRALYEHFQLSSDSPFYQFTYRLFKQQQGLPRAVVTFKLVTRSSYSHQAKDKPTWIDERIFSKMTRLRSITFDGIPCHRGARFQQVISHVYKNCPQLQEISILNAPRMNLANSIIRRKLDVPLTLAKISFGLTCGSGFFSSTFFTPPNVITTLELLYSAGVLEDVIALKFPKLHTFSLSGLVNASGELMTFLNAHPTIRNLSLPDVSSLNIPSGPKDGLLPNLDIIAGTARCITSLASVCNRVKFVRCLTLNSPGGVEMEQLKSMISELPKLKHCSVQGIYGSTTLNVLKNFPEAQELEWWTGGFYYHNIVSLTPISSALSSFPKLTRVDVFEWSPPLKFTTNTHLKGFKYMAKRNPSLQKISLYMPHSPNYEIAAVFNVHWKDGLQKVYQYNEDRRHDIGDRRRVQFDTMDWQLDPPL